VSCLDLSSFIVLSNKKAIEGCHEKSSINSMDSMLVQAGLCWYLWTNIFMLFSSKTELFHQHDLAELIVNKPSVCMQAVF